MAFNGSGVFNRLYNWANDKAANIKVRADRMDNEMNGFATGLSTCITKDGQTTVTANLPMAGFKHTGVGNASARTDYAVAGQIQDGSYVWVDGGGSADAITATYSPAVTALVDGMELRVRATAANTTTTPTFSPNGLTARTIVKNGGTALEVGDISADNHELILRYFLASTRWELLNPAKPVLPSALTTLSTAFVPASSASAASLAFAEDTDNGTNKVTLKAPAAISADADITLPASGTLATLAGAETFTNKTFDSTSVGATQTTGDNSTKLATTAFVQQEIAAIPASKQMVANSNYAGATAGSGGVNFSNNLSKNRTGTGVYDFTFGVAQADTNYQVYGNGLSSTANKGLFFEISSKTTSGFTVTVYTVFTATVQDPTTADISVFRY